MIPQDEIFEILNTDDVAMVESAARKAGLDRNKLFIAPYNDPDVIEGQGTIGIEIIQQLNKITRAPDYVFVTVGGGGLISGVATTVKKSIPKLKDNRRLARK